MTDARSGPDPRDPGSDSSPDLLLVSVDGGVATVVLNRPEARNALDAALLDRLDAELRRLDADTDVGAVVLTGAGPAFCAGLDLHELRKGPELMDLATGTLDDRKRSPVPPMETLLVGAVNGACITGGLELALACDLLLAAEEATFADTHVAVGLMPAWGMTALLPAAIGVRRAKQLSTSGRPIDATTALAWGLVNEVHPAAELVPAAQVLARQVATRDRRAVARLLATYDEGAAVDGAHRWAVEDEIHATWNHARPAVSVPSRASGDLQ